MNESALTGRLNGYPSTELSFFSGILAQGNMGWPFQDSVIFPGFWHIQQGSGKNALKIISDNTGRDREGTDMSKGNIGTQPSIKSNRC